LAHVLEGAKDGAFAATIVGQAGVGKTILLDEALRQASVAGWTIVRIGFTAAEREFSWSGLATLVAQADPSWYAELSESQRRAVDVALGERAAGGATSINPHVASVVRAMLRNAARQAPTILAIDDLQWADPATAAVTAAALRTLAAEPLAIVVTSRPTVDPPIDLARIFGHRHVVIEPQPFRRAEVHELLRRRGLTVSVPMLDDVASLSGGNPLHCELLAAQIQREGWRPGRLPTSIALSYRAALDGLGGDVTLALEHAAVHGEVDLKVLTACLPMIDVDVLLLMAERAGLVGVGSQPDSLVFTHPMVQAAILEGVGPLMRRRLHCRLAEVLPVDAELRAVHLGAAATDPDETVAGALDAAAQRALGRGARHVAGQRMLRAAEMTPADRPQDRWRRVLAAADAFMGGGSLDDAERPSIDAFDSAVDPMQLALAGGVRAQLLAARGDLVDTHRFVVDLLGRLDGWAMLRGFLGRARVRLEQVIDLHLALQTAEEMQAEMAAAGLAVLSTEFEIAAGNASFVLGRPVDPGNLWKLARPNIDATDFISAGWMALEVLVWSCHDEELAFGALHEFEEAAVKAGAEQALAKLYDYRANLLTRVGRWDEGEAEMRRAVDAVDLSELAGATSRSGLAWILAARGQIAEARESLLLCSTASASEQTPLLMTIHAASAGFVELCDGQWERATTILGRAWGAADKVGMGDLCAMPFRADLVEALLLCGRVAEARERAEHIVQLAQVAGFSAGLMQAERALTMVCAAESNLDGACAAAERGLGLHRQFEVPIERARIQLAVGTALRRAGQRQEAAVALDDASTIFRRLGALPFLARADDELKRLGSRRNNDELTATEEQIARLVAVGRTNAEVAAELVVSLRTVESHLTRVYRKLAVRSRAELAATFRAAP
jgi:DNA-binding CsgD family transcriptional regulator